MGGCLTLLVIVGAGTLVAELSEEEQYLAGWFCCGIPLVLFLVYIVYKLIVYIVSKRIRARIKLARDTGTRSFSQATKIAALLRDGQCRHCGCRDPAELQYDHIEPWSQGGPSTLENCQVLCRRCNAAKSNK